MNTHSVPRLLLPVVIAGGFGLLGAGPAHAAVVQVTSRVVAYSGMPAPGASPAVFDNFNYPAIAPGGEIVFRGRLATGSNTYGLWRESFDPGTGNPVLGLVQREGAASPVAGFNFAGFPGPPTINLPGRFAFKAHISQGAIFNDTLWVEKPAPTGLTLVAREGAPAPGVPGANFGAIFVHAGYDPLLLDDSGRTLFAGQLTGGGVTTADDVGLWFYDGSTATLVAREGDQMPGVPAGHFFIDTFQTANSALLGNGIFVFSGSDGHPVTPIVGLWSNHSGSVQPLILQGGSAPGLASDEKLTLIASFRINNNNQVAFSGLVEKDDGINPVSIFKAVWISDSQGAFQLAARSDQQPPDFRVPHVAVFTDGGHVFGVDENGTLGRVTTGGLTIIAKPGDPAPGTAAGVLFGGFGAIAASSAGQVAFTAAMTGTGVNLANDRGLWAQDGSLQIVKVAREGDSIEVPAGTPRTITGIEFALGAGSGQPRGMSDRGEVLWKANVAGLPNASQVVAVTGVGTLPPPPTLVGLEVVQVVQDWRNRIPLVAGKRTFVRAHLESSAPVRFFGHLRAFTFPGGVELAGSPLAPANPGEYVNLGTDADAVRDQLGGGLYFELPPAWTSGTLAFRVESSGGSLLCQEVAGPVAQDCQAVATFVPAEKPELRFLTVNWQDFVRDTIRTVSFDRTGDLVRRMVSAFPITDVEWSYGAYGGTFYNPPRPTVMLEDMDYTRTQDGCTEAAGCKRIYYGAIDGRKHDDSEEPLGIAYTGKSASTGFVPLSSRTVPGRHTHT
ncbi:MAG: DUF7453 family protein, partial [Thermoanaerobaculia bacterium]